MSGFFTVGVSFEKTIDGNCLAHYQEIYKSNTSQQEEHVITDAGYALFDYNEKTNRLILATLKKLVSNYTIANYIFDENKNNITLRFELKNGNIWIVNSQIFDYKLNQLITNNVNIKRNIPKKETSLYMLKNIINTGFENSKTKK